MKKAFTLIEILVVLSLLALIAILAYNLFGNTMKDAQISRDATLIVKDMQSFSDAFEKYVVDNKAEPAAANLKSHTTMHGSWIEDYLRQIPQPPASAETTGCDTTYNYALSMRVWSYPNEATTANDVYVTLQCIDDDTCREINGMYAPSIGNDIHNSANATTFPLPEEHLYCTAINASRNSVNLIISLD